MPMNRREALLATLALPFAGMVKAMNAKQAASCAFLASGKVVAFSSAPERGYGWVKMRHIGYVDTNGKYHDFDTTVLSKSPEHI